MLFPLLSNRIGYKNVMIVGCVFLLLTVNAAPLISTLAPSPHVTLTNTTAVHPHCSHSLRMHHVVSQLIYTQCGC